jgi:intron-binding protein aquarius
LKEEEGGNVPGETQMENVEHLGQYVFEMTNAKIQQIRTERGLPDAEAGTLVGATDGDVEFGGVEEENDEVHEELEEGFEAEEDE